MNCRNALGSTSHADKGCPLKVPARAVSNAKKQSIPAQTGLTALVRVFCADGAEPRRGLWSSRCPCSCGHSCFSPSLLALWRLPRMGNSIWPQTAQRLPLPKRQSQRLPMARRWWRIRIRSSSTRNKTNCSGRWTCLSGFVWRLLLTPMRPPICSSGLRRIRY